MKKFIYIVLFTFLFIPLFVSGSENEVNMYLFYGNGCPHCAALEKFLDPYVEENDDVNLYKYEVWYDEDNQEKYMEVHKILEDNTSGVPYLIIGKNTITGYGDNTPEKIKNAVNYYRKVKIKDEVGIYLGIVNETDDEVEETKKYEDDMVDIPILGNMNGKDVPLLLSTIIIGLVDGFNPCAMWILIFLISMLLGMSNKKRKWILGITFLFASAATYFLFLISWLNLAVFLNNIIYVRLAIAFIAIVFGAYSVIKFIKNLSKKNDDGCEVVDSKNRKRIINSIKKIVKEKSFILALLGIILLAVSVNIIELLCSLGLPVMFSEILTLNNVSDTSKIIYSLIYVLFFLIDDIIVFIIAMKTMEIKVVSNKFGKYSHLIGGLIMLLIGLLIMVKPEWLMFNF